MLSSAISVQHTTRCASGVRSDTATFLGGPCFGTTYEPLHLWMQKNHAATLAEDRAAMTKIDREFTGYVNELLQVRRAAGAQSNLES